MSVLGKIKQLLTPPKSICKLCDAELGSDYGTVKYIAVDEESGDMTEHKMSICPACCEKLESGAILKDE